MLFRQRVAVKRHIPSVVASVTVVILLEGEAVGGSTTHSHHTEEGLEVLYLMVAVLTSEL